MRPVLLFVPLLVLFALPTAEAQVRRPLPPRPRSDTTTRAPEPTSMPCSVSCAPLEHEQWREFHAHIDAGLSGGSTRVATDVQPGLGVARFQGNVAWIYDVAAWQFGTSADLWTIPSMNGVSGWGTDVLLRGGRTLFEGGPELQLGAGVGLNRLSAELPSAPRSDHLHVGFAYEGAIAQEFRRESPLGIVVSAGVVGMHADGGYPRLRPAMFIAGLGLRWHRWGSGGRDAGRRTRHGPRWPRPLP